MFLYAFSSLIGFPNSKWSVTDNGNFSSESVVNTSKNGTFSTQALYNSGCKFKHAYAVNIPPALVLLEAMKLG
jgi:hypothetical protein